MPIRELSSFDKFQKDHPSFTNGGLRDQRFKQDQNGAQEIQVFVSIGSRVYINPQRYFLWAELQTTGELDNAIELIRRARNAGRYLSPEDAVAQIRGRSAA